MRTPNKSKTPIRGTSLDRKTPMSLADDSEYNPDNTCMFCGELNEKFIKQGFEMHYWKSCPMLKQCNDCKQVNLIYLKSSPNIILVAFFGIKYSLKVLMFKKF